MKFEIYNYKTGEPSGRKFDDREAAERWIASRKSETAITLHWKIRKVEESRAKAIVDALLNEAPRQAGPKVGDEVSPSSYYVTTDPLRQGPGEGGGRKARDLTDAQRIAQNTAQELKTDAYIVGIDTRIIRVVHGTPPWNW